jgi:chromosome segregation ATPase
MKERAAEMAQLHKAQADKLKLKGQLQAAEQLASQQQQRTSDQAAALQPVQQKLGDTETTILALQGQLKAAEQLVSQQQQARKELEAAVRGSIQSMTAALSGEGIA